MVIQHHPTNPSWVWIVGGLDSIRKDNWFRIKTAHDPSFPVSDWWIARSGPYTDISNGILTINASPIRETSKGSKDWYSQKEEKYT